MQFASGSGGFELRDNALLFKHRSVITEMVAVSQIFNHINSDVTSSESDANDTIAQTFIDEILFHLNLFRLLGARSLTVTST